MPIFAMFNTAFMGRHAYLILAHANPGQLQKLLSSLDDGRNDIYVHLDRKARFGREGFSCMYAGLEFIAERCDLSWGGVNMVRAEIALLEEAVKTEHSYYHLISGMDLPLKSQDEIHSFFEEHDGCEFLNLWTFKPSKLDRVLYRYPFPEGHDRVLTKILNGLSFIVQKTLGIRRNTDVDFKLGSQWFSITHAFATYAAGRKDWVEKVFSHSRICDEFLMPTLLWNSEFRDRLYMGDCVDSHSVNCSNMRYIDWNRGGSKRHPAVFTIEDLELLKSVPHLWARKFDENVDGEIIDALVSYVSRS